MFKRTLSGIMLTLLLIGMLTLAFNIQPVKAGTITVPDGYPTIQEAINAASVGDTVFVRNGTYYENVVANKTISLIGENRNTVIIDGRKIGDVVEITVSNVKVTGFTIQNSGAYRSGIRIWYCSAKDDISYNIIRNNTDGINLFYSVGSCTISRNVVVNNNRGILLLHSGNNTLFNNIMTGNTYNLVVWGDTDFELDNSLNTSNTVDGKPVYYVKGATDIVYDAETNAGTFYLINCNNITVKDLSLTNNGHGVFLWKTTCSKIENVTFSNNIYGMKLWYSNGNRMSGNNVYRSSYDGISLIHSDNNQVTENSIREGGSAVTIGGDNNTVNSNRLFRCEQAIWIDGGSHNKIFQNEIETVSYSNGVGVDLSYAGDFNYVGYNSLTGCGIEAQHYMFGSGNLIECNRISFAEFGIFLVEVHKLLFGPNTMRFNELYNCTYGIGLVGLEDVDIECIGNIISRSEYALWVLCLRKCVIAENVISDNKYAIYIDECKNGTFCRNTVSNNSYLVYGASLSDMLVLHHNNFIRNLDGFEADMFQWDDGILSNPEGNFWSDYSGQDNGTGIGRYGESRVAGDGVGDTNIPHHGLDWYPLMEPWIRAVNATVDIIPNTLNLRAKPKYVTAFIELPEGYNISDIDISSILLNNTIAVDPDAPWAIGDYDNDSIPDLMVKFDRDEVTSYILANVNMTEPFEERFMAITLTMTGKLHDGTSFDGSDTVRIMMPRAKGPGKHTTRK